MIRLSSLCLLLAAACATTPEPEPAVVTPATPVGHASKAAPEPAPSKKEVMSTYAHLENTDLPDFDELWNFGQPDETEKKFRELLPRARKQGTTDYTAQLLTQLARTRGLRGEFKDSHEILDEVERMLTPDMQVARTRYLLERGRAFNSDNQPHMGRTLFSEAWETARNAHSDFYAVDAAHMLAIVEEAGSKLQWNLKAMEVAEASEDPRTRGWLSAIYNNIGWDYFAEEKYEQALEIFRKAENYNRDEAKERWTQINRWSVAKTLRVLGQVEEALAIQEQLDSEYEASGGERTGYTYEELGECLLLLDRKEEAGKNFALAYERLSKDHWLVREEPERIARLKQLGGVSD